MVLKIKRDRARDRKKGRNAKKKERLKERQRDRMKSVSEDRAIGPIQARGA